jgi:hypothetical protein
MTEWAMVQLAAPLLVTLLAEVSIAALFGLRGAGVGAVFAANFVTNPALTAVAFTLYWLGIGFGYDFDSGRILTAAWTWPVLGLLEVIMILIEWRLLVWALGDTAGTARELLAPVVVMNVVSATLGTVAVRYMLTLWAG